MTKVSMRDSGGAMVSAGDAVRFSFGIPPIGVVAQVVQRGTKLVSLTPRHTPTECELGRLRKYVGDWYKDTETL